MLLIHLLALGPSGSYTKRLCKNQVQQCCVDVLTDFLTILSLTQQHAKPKLESQVSRPEVETAELPLMAAILGSPAAPAPQTPAHSSVDRDREMARKREQERRRREAVSYTPFLRVSVLTA